MALTQRLLIRQSQALVMTPQLMQAIKLLQLSNLDLVAYVEAELERNPLLDRGAESEPAGEPEGAPSPDQPVMDGELRNGSDVSDDPHRELELNGHVRDDAPGTSPGENYNDDSEPTQARAADGPASYSEWAGTGSGGRDDGEYNLEAFVSSETTLADWLREQLTLAIANATSHGTVVVLAAGNDGSSQPQSNGYPAAASPEAITVGGADPSGRLSGVVAPMQIDTCSEDLLRDSRAAAREHGLPFTIHVSQSVNEVREMIRRHGMTPIQWAQQLDLLGPGAILGHALFLDTHSWVRWHSSMTRVSLAIVPNSPACCPSWNAVATT